MNISSLRSSAALCVDISFNAENAEGRRGRRETNYSLSSFAISCSSSLKSIGLVT